jgi:hypothetical protein
LSRQGTPGVVTWKRSWRGPDFWEDETGKRVTAESVDVSNPEELIGAATHNHVDGIVFLGRHPSASAADPAGPRESSHDTEAWLPVLIVSMPDQ